MLPFRVIPAHHPRPAASPRNLCSRRLPRLPRASRGSCRGVSALDRSSLLSFGLNRHSPLTAVFLPFPFNRLRTLSFSVSSKSFACHSLGPSGAEGYENSRVCTNNSHSGTRHSPRITRHCTQVLSFDILANSFALKKIATLLFSSKSELFAQNYPGGGVLPSRTPRFAERGVPLCS